MGAPEPAPPNRADAGHPLRVSVIGHGAIGRVVATRLAAGAVPGAALAGIVIRSRLVGGPGAQLSLGEAIDRSDVLVECAGQTAVREAGPAVVAAGRTLVVSSVGALADPGLAQQLLAGPGHVHCTHGAVGGLDLLSAATDAAPFDRVLVRTTKSPPALVQGWMSDDQRAAVLGTSAPYLVFRGTPAEAARLFPASLNVAMTVAFSVGEGTDVEVELHADPTAEFTRHEIEAQGEVGHYRWRIENRPSAANPRTSAVVPYSILRTVARLTERPPLVS